MAFRLDVGTLNPPRRLSDGRLRVDGYLTRTGVFIYRNADGTERREYRPPEEVFHKDALESFSMAPLTNEHPPEMVTSANAKQYAVGWLGENVRQDGEKVAASLMVADEDAIKEVEAGKRQTSCGYHCDIDETPGVSPKGERYDVVQRNIRGNHVAFVKAGRAGPEVCVRMDAAQMMTEFRADAAHEGSEIAMEELQKQLAAAMVKAAEADARATSEKARADAAEAQCNTIRAERDSEKARADKAEKARNDSDASISERVAARVDLERKASEILGSEVELTKLTDREIKVQVVEKIDGDKIAESETPDYIRARFDRCLKQATDADQSLGDFRRATADAVDRTDILDEEKERLAMQERNRKLWESARVGSK